MLRTRLIRIGVILTVTLALAGCASRWNPWNWFRRSAPVERVDTAGVPVDPRQLVATVETMTVEATPTGAIVRATGLSPTQGWWDAELVALPDAGEGRLVLEFRILPPVVPKAANTPRSREVTVAYSVSARKLEGLREIVVQGAGNARAVRR
ncbi:MAG: hypothetical protein IAE87_19125 [Rhodobacteraceae bacterium]|jgi:hypothetical protein|nr:hypothetical protein [Paracoccaceae bacterium]